MSRTEPKYRPILFSAPMVRAILEGRKTQTRRVVKAPRSSPLRESVTDWLVSASGHQVDTRYWHDALAKHCPCGAPGDQLWVRETWRPAVQHLCAGDSHLCDCDGVRVVYAADGADRYFDGGEIAETWGVPQAAGRGNVPGIHMPRWASRLTLEVTGVRVERLHDITEKDAKAEGLQWAPGAAGGDTYGLNDVPGSWQPTARAAFEVLWRSINGTESWDANPWVWVVEFKRVAP